MSLSFSINSKSQQNRLKKPTASFTDAGAGSDASSKNYVTEFSAGAPPPLPESKIKPILPIPNAWCPTKKLKNLPNLPRLSNDSALQFELDTGSHPEASDCSMGYGLNLRRPSAAAAGEGSVRGNGETISDMELRKLREDLEKLPDDTGMDEYTDVPVEGFGAALLSGYGWKEGRGIGRNAKEDVKVSEVTKKRGRGGLGFTGELPGNRVDTNSSDVKDIKNGKAESVTMGNQKEKKGFDAGQEVRILNGKEMGLLCKIIEVRHGGDLLVLRIPGSNEKLKFRSRDVAKVGSAEEEKCLRKLKELKVKESNATGRINDKKIPTKGGQEARAGKERINWLRNHIRVRIISEEFKGGRLFLKKGVIVDVVGPGLCDVAMDESMELVQGVDQDLLETALPKRGGSVLVLYGKHQGVYGSLLEKDSQKETGVVQDADTSEFLNVRLDQIAEFTGDPSDIGY